MSDYEAAKVIICGGDPRLAERGDCPDPLHNWPLPAGYVDASEVAASRIYRRWSSGRCRLCGLFGWVPGKLAEEDIFVPPPAPTPVPTTNGGDTDGRDA